MITNMTRGSIEVTVGGRTATVPGEAYPIESGPPTFEAYGKLLQAWDDGTEMTEAEKRAVLDDLRADARARGWEVAVLDG